MLAIQEKKSLIDFIYVSLENEIKVLINRDTGDIKIYRKLIIVENPENSNLEINYVEDDPISVNVKKYEDRLNIKKQKKSRFFDHHKLENYLFNP